MKMKKKKYETLVLMISIDVRILCKELREYMRITYCKTYN